MPDDRSPAASNPAQLQHDIDSGRTGDKIAGFDPAAAPLGTDEEAGGSPAAPELVAESRRAERAAAPNSATQNAATPALQPDAQLSHRPFLTPLLVGGVIALALVAVMMLVGPI
jgi:hypothetical protein